jgi:hypothetical protein
MQDRVKRLFNEAMSIRDEIFIQKALTGYETEEDKLIYDFLEKFGEDYIKLTDELHVLKPFTFFIRVGD